MVQIRLDLPEVLHRQLTNRARSSGRSLESYLLSLMAEEEETAPKDGEDDTSPAPSPTSLFRFPDDPLMAVQERYLVSIAELQPQIIAIQEKVLAHQYAAVQGCLEAVAEHGLTGEHHFLFVFATRAPDVEIPGFLMARFPETMKIVLQHQFSQLEVDAEGFSVVLWFGGQPHRLGIPFSALLAFSDPAVGLQMAFPPPATEAIEEPEDESPATSPDEVVDNVVELSAFRKK